MNEERPLFSRAWIISDGKIGDLVQCEGIAQAIGVKAEVKIVSPTKPWVWFMPRGPLAPADRPANASSPIKPPFPDLVIASGFILNMRNML